MKKIMILFFSLFICIYGQKSAHSQEIPNIKDSLLSKNYWHDYLISISYSSKERDINEKQSMDIYYEFMQLYQNKEFEKAISKIEAAIQIIPIGVYYYYYGNCLMLLYDYEYAEQAFLRALEGFDRAFEPWYQTYNFKNDPRYTFDNNDVPREAYFTYYNLACIYSITNNLDLALDYLEQSFEYGFPYIEHVYNDQDLVNLLASSQDIKNQIHKKYNDGFLNNFTGIAYRQTGPSYSYKYYFVNSANMYCEYGGEAHNYIMYGTYEIKNYQIFINYTKEEGNIAYDPETGRIIPSQDYEKNINITSIVSIKELLKRLESKNYDLPIWDIIPFNPKEQYLVKLNEYFPQTEEKKITIQENTEYSQITADDSIYEPDKQSLTNEQKNNNGFLWIIIGISVLFVGIILLIVVKKKK